MFYYKKEFFCCYLEVALIKEIRLIMNKIIKEIVRGEKLYIFLL